MSNLRRGPGSRSLFDNVTGAFAGVLDLNGNEQLIQQASIVARSRTTQCGHSFQSNGWVGGPAQVTSLNALMWASTQLNQGFDIVNNFGAPGTTLQDFVNTQLASVVADDSDIVDLCTGVNDLADSTTTGVGAAAWEALVRSTCAALGANKRLILWRSIDPVFITYADRALEAPLYNEITARVCAEFPNVIFVNTTAALQDTTTFAFQPLTALLYDNRVHPNTAGAYRQGVAIARAVRDRVRIIPGYSILRQTLLPALGTSGGTAVPGSGTITQTNPIPANMSVTIGGADTGTVVVTTVAPNGNQPKRLRLTITSSGANSFDLTNTNTSSYPSAIATGEIMRAFARIRMLAQTNLLECSLFLNRNGQLVYANQYNSAIETASNGGAVGWPTEGLVANLKTRPLVATGTSSSLAVRLRLTFSAAGTATFDLYDGWGVEVLSKT
jgi:hypothetical protein